MAKSTPYKLAKKKAWQEFSQYIRTRDCIRFKNDPNEGICITCKREYPKKQLQAGHFIEGRTNAVLFDERIVYSQCAGCNLVPPRGKGGNQVEYFIFMEQEWGRDKIDEFRALKHQSKKYKEFELKELAKHYKQKTKELLKEY